MPRVVPFEFNGDLSKMPRTALSNATNVLRFEKPEREGPPNRKRPSAADAARAALAPAGAITGPLAPAPGPLLNFAGLNRTDIVTGGQAGAGTPPDTNGEVGPNHFIQAVNDAYAIYNKSGTQLAAFTETSLWSTGSGLCATNPVGDPVVLYDALADRWILTHFAFAFSGNNTVAPYFQCIAASKTNDPVAGGWWLFPVRMDDATHVWLNDYGKFGIWPDGLYMAANGFSGAGAFQGTFAAVFNRSDLYSGAALRSVITYIANTSDPFTMIPSHITGRMPSQQPAANTPNYFVSESGLAFAFEVRKYTVNWNTVTGTLGGPVNVSQASYTVAGTIPEASPGNALDSLGDRLMQKVHYRKVGAAESLWVTHTFQSAAGPTGSQWAQINVTGGTVATTTVQQQNYDPADGFYRWMSSLGVDNQGNMALGYSKSSATSFPAIAYSGRLASDPLNTLPQTETILVAGGGGQSGNCGPGPCARWGDYSGMSVDPADDCTFWYTSEYYAANLPSNIAWNTRIGSFKFPTCTPPWPTVQSVSVLFGSQSYNLTTNTLLRVRLPWQITGVRVVFSSSVTATAASMTGTTANSVTGSGTTTVTWNFASPLAIGNYAISLAGSGVNAVTDSATTNPLGGGSGAAQNFKVLVGDFDDDGNVASNDMAAVFNATAAPYNILADINGDGVVNITDVTLTRSNIGKVLP